MGGDGKDALINTSKACDFITRNSDAQCMPLLALVLESFTNSCFCLLGMTTQSLLCLPPLLPGLCLPGLKVLILRAMVRATGFCFMPWQKHLSWALCRGGVSAFCCRLWFSVASGCAWLGLLFSLLCVWAHTVPTQIIFLRCQKETIFSQWKLALKMMFFRSGGGWVSTDSLLLGNWCRTKE